MKLKIIIDKKREEEVIIYAREKSALVKSIEALVETSDEAFTAFSDGSIKKISADEIYCFVSQGNKVYALTEKEKLLIKEKLYQAEEKTGSSFIRINQSCIGSVTKIKRFDVSISGTLKIIFKNGYTDYVSRRQIKNVKERLGL